MNTNLQTGAWAGAAALALLVLAPGPELEASGPAPALASVRGCTVCHRDEATLRSLDGSVPLAPSWRAIAARYRGEGDAEERLTRIVIEGADPADRHWKDRIEFTAMRGSGESLTPGEARALVRWILASP